MAFQTCIFSDNGLVLLSQVASTRSLVIDTVIPITAAQSEYNVTRNPVSSFEALRNNDVEATIISAGADPDSDTNARIVISLKASTEQTVRTIIVAAHTTQAGAGTSPVVLFGCIDPNGIVIPLSGSVPISVNVAVSFAFDRANSITVGTSDPAYLLADEVNRFVTTHSVTSSEAGDAQSIYGVKSFKDDVVIARESFNNAALQFSYNDDGMARISAVGGMGLTIDLEDTASAGGTLFTMRDPYYSSVLTVETDAVTAQSLVRVYTLSTYTVEAAAIQPRFGSSLTVGGSIFPEGDDTHDLGSSNSAFSTVYTYGLNTYGISSPSGTISVSTLVAGSSSTDIGDATYPFNAVYSNNYFLHGVKANIPEKLVRSGNAVNVKVGSLVLVITPAGTATITAGTDRAYNANTLHPVKCSNDGGFSISADTATVPAGTYHFLNTVNGPDCLALVIRVA